jgi:Thiamine pyrophosphate enzyme, C-terminal TPP binding domain
MFGLVVSNGSTRPPPCAAGLPSCPRAGTAGDRDVLGTLIAKHPHVLLDNHSLGKEQLAADFPVWHTSLHNPDWAAYAELCGATGIKAECRDQLDQAMARLFATDGPAMLHVSQDPELL